MAIGTLERVGTRGSPESPPQTESEIKGRIILATEQYFPTLGGVPAVINQLAKSLTSQGWEVHIIAPSGNRKDYDEQSKFAIVHRIAGRQYADQQFSFPLRRNGTEHHFLSKKMDELFEEIKPSVVHIETPWVIGRAAIKAARRFEAHHSGVRIPIIASAHIMPENIESLLGQQRIRKERKYPLVLRKLAEKLAVKFMVHTYNQADVVIVPTESAEQKLLELGVVVDTEVISNGVDIKEHFNPERIEKERLEEMRKDLKLKEGVPVIGYVGRMVKEKNADLIVDSIKSLVSSNPNMEFYVLLAGGGPERERIMKKAEELGLTEHMKFFNGEKNDGRYTDEDEPYLFQLCDIFAMTGFVELQSISTMKAMAMGKPVVAANALALPELVPPCAEEDLKKPLIEAENGYLFTPDPTVPIRRQRNIEHMDEKNRKVVIAAIARGFQNLLESPESRLRMGMRSREIIKRHDQDLVGIAMGEVYALAEALYESKRKPDIRTGSWIPR